MKKILKIILVIIIVLIFIIFIRKNNKNNFIENNVESKNNLSINNIVNNEDLMNNSVIEDTIQTNIGLVNEEDNMDGKTVLCIGDSLIRGYGNDDKGIDYYLSEFYPNTTFINNSKSGSTITTNTGDDEIVIKNQLNNITQEPDIILLNGGANDIIGYSMGFLEASKKNEIGNFENLKENTVIYDFDDTINEIRNKFPNAKIYYLNLILLDDNSIFSYTENTELINDIKLRGSLFYNEIQKVFDKYGVTYIDLSFVFDNSEINYRQNDLLHINELGYKAIVSNLIDKIKY